MRPLTFILAQTKNVSEIYFYLVIIVVASALVIALAIFLKKRLTGEPRDTGDGLFLMSDLRKLRDEGQISDEEFERARAAIIARGKAMLGGNDEETVDAETEIHLPDADISSDSDNLGDDEDKSE